MIEYGGEERQQIRPGPDSHIHPESPIMLLVKNLAPFFFHLLLFLVLFRLSHETACLHNISLRI